jgi:hypothetical protein
MLLLQVGKLTQNANDLMLFGLDGAFCVML